MKREHVTLTPEEARRYEMFSVLETQKAAQHRPIASTDKRQERNEATSIINLLGL